MEFLQDLSEARLFGGGRSGIKRYNAKDIADIFFLHIIALQILNHNFYGAPEIKKYLHNAGNLINFDYWSSARNEIYVLLHILTGRQAKKQQSLLQDQEASQEFLKNIKINMPLMRKFLRLVKSGQHDEAFERRFLLELERDLMVTNGYYRSLRRLVSTWKRQPESTKRLVMTRLLQIFRTKARRSELLSILEYVSRKDRLEDKSLEPLPGTGSEKAAETPVPPKKMSLLKNLAAFGAGMTTGAAGGYALTRTKKST